MKVLLVLLLFLATCTLAQVNRVAQTSDPTRVETVSRGLDHVAKLAGLASLKSAKLSKGNLEARVWHGFGLILFEGFVIKRIDNRWTAFHLKADSHNPCYTTRVTRTQLSKPKSGWEKCWQRLVEAGLLTLQSGTELPDEDGEGFVVETLVAGVLRNYEYSSPEYSESPHAKRMIAIGDIIADEFALPRFQVKRRSQ